nr:BON domain-containing protein [Aureimonas sp. SK2]
MGERDARRRAAYGERDAYGEWDRENYGRSGTETGYGRERYGADRYDAPQPRSSERSFAGAYDDRFGRTDDNRDWRNAGGYGDDRFGRRESYGGDRGYGYDRSYGDRDRDRRAAGYGPVDRVYSDEAYRGEERSFVERAGDEIASWFGDEDAERRREADRRFGGRGPKGYTRSDERIHDDVNDRLTDDHYVDASDIEVTVKGREVTLSGHVPSRDQKRRAEDLAERVSGVTHVQNNLRVETAAGSYGGSATTGTVASPSEVGGPRGWSTDTTVKTVS